MAHTFSLAFLTVGNISPLEAINIAYDTGYSAVGLRMLPSTQDETDYALLHDEALLKATCRALNDTGVKVCDVEIIRLKEHTNVADFDQFLDHAAELGANHVLVAADDHDQTRLTDNFARFCESAAKRHLTADLEAMPWTAVKNFTVAQSVVEKAGQHNGGLLIDPLHFYRAGNTTQQLASLAKHRLHYAQLCDGPSVYDPSDKGLIHVARKERLMPGHGALDLKDFLQHMPDGLTLSIEVANEAILRQQGAKSCAQCAIQAARQIVEVAGRQWF